MSTDWKSYGNCDGASPHLFFAESDRLKAIAKTLCQECLVKDICLHMGMDEMYGIWGGMDFHERGLLKRRRKYWVQRYSSASQLSSSASVAA